MVTTFPKGNLCKDRRCFVFLFLRHKEDAKNSIGILGVKVWVALGQTFQLCRQKGHRKFEPATGKQTFAFNYRGRTG